MLFYTNAAVSLYTRAAVFLWKCKEDVFQRKPAFYIVLNPAKLIARLAAPVSIPSSSIWKYHIQTTFASVTLLYIYIFLWPLGGKWSLSVVFISIRKPEYLLSGLAVREVPPIQHLGSAWDARSSTSAPSSPCKKSARAGHRSQDKPPSIVRLCLTVSLPWIPIHLHIKSPALIRAEVLAKTSDFHCL